MGNKNDRWSALSMKERADLIKLYVNSGISSLAVMREDYNGAPYSSFNSSEYDYFNAHPSNAPTKKEDHWTSRNPKTGQLLKREDHPTFNLMIEGEEQAGYNIVKGLDGNLYSVPNEPNNYVENYNSFENGGEKEPLYYDDTYIEPAVVKAFKSQEDYNRYYGEQFGKQIAKKRDKVANNIMHALEYTPFVGDGIDVANTIASINEGDYSKAAVLAGLALLPNAIEKPLKGAKKIGRSITHAFSSDYLPTILSDKFGRGVINPSMAVSPATKTFDNLYGDIVLVGDKTLLDDSFLFRGDGDTSAVGWFTDAYDEVKDVHKVSSQMRAHDVNSPVPQLAKERFLELEAHPEYHEVKRNRITGLNEFKHALVPEEFMQNQEMLEYLNEMGIPYSSYSEGNKVQAINAFLEEHPELLFKCGGKLNKK